MNILVAKNGSQLGPFLESDLRAKLASGEFSPTDYGWHEGLPSWVALSQLLGDAPLGPVAPPPAPAVPPSPQLYAPQPYTPSPGPGAPGGSAPLPYNSPYPQPYQPGALAGWGTPPFSGYAGFWLRLGAYVIDVIILYIPFFVLMLVVGVVFGVASGGRHVSADHQSALAGIIVLVEFAYIVLVWLYFAGLESSGRQATFGKLAVGIKVTDLHGNRIGFGKATGRFFGRILSSLFFGIGYFMAGFTERKQALHDMVASTLVVRK